MTSRPFQCVYLIKYAKTNLVKIGISSNWYDRSKCLQVGTKTLPLAVVLTPNNAKAEKDLHDKFDEYRLPGSEYFNLDEDKTREAINTAFSYGTPLSSWFTPPPQLPCPADNLLKQQYVEISRAFACQFLRQIRLRYKQRITCILENISMYLEPELVRYFTVFLDIHVQKLKLRSKSSFYIEKDWYLRLRVIENYLNNFFKLFRIYVDINTETIYGFNIDSLVFTTVKNNTYTEYRNLPLTMRIIFELLWCTHDFYSDVLDVKNLLDKQRSDWFTPYVESYGPIYYTKEQLLPSPIFPCIVKKGNSI